jgi:hypothetical protein
MLFNIFGNFGSWDGDSVGYLSTVQCDDVTTLQAKMQNTLTAPGATLATVHHIDGAVFPDAIGELLDNMELNVYMEGVFEYATLGSYAAPSSYVGRVMLVLASEVKVEQL